MALWKDGRELETPRFAAQDKQAHEVLRVWTGETEYVAITDRLYKEPALWGQLLCHVARHIANAYELNGFKKRDEVLAQIRRQFLDTWDDASTDDATGVVVDE